MSVPLVLLADVILLAEVHEVGDGLGSKELETVDDIDLWGILGQHLVKVSVRDGEDQSKNVLISILGRYSRHRRAGLSSLGLFVIREEGLQSWVSGK